MSKKKLKKSTEDYLKAVLAQTEERAGKSILEAILESTVGLDRLCMSMLIVAGAAVTLSVSNANEITKVIGNGSLAWMLGLIIVSGVSGFFAKGFFTIATIALEIQKSATSVLEEHFGKYDEFEEDQIQKAEKFTSIDPPEISKERVFQSMLAGLPKFVRRRIEKKGIREGDGNNFYVWATTATTFQFWLLVSQAVLLVVGFLVAVFGIE